MFGSAVEWIIVLPPLMVAVVYLLLVLAVEYGKFRKSRLDEGNKETASDPDEGARD